MQTRLDPVDIDAVILCGGKGERLRSVVSDRPKPLAEVGGRPFLDILIDYAAGYGLRRFVLLAGYMGDLVKEYACQKARSTSLEIACVLEKKPLGTGGAIKNAEQLLNSSRILVFNGDTFCPANLLYFFMFHSKKGGLATMMLSRVEHAKDCGQVLIDSDGRIVTFQEKTDITYAALANAGVYLLERAILDIFSSGSPCSLERDIFPKIAGGDFFGYVVKDPHLDIGTPERYFKALSILPVLCKRGW